MYPCLPQCAEVPRASWLGHKESLAQELVLHKALLCLYCVFIVALCLWRYARGLRGLGLPPGGTKRLDVSFAFAFGLPDAPSDLPLYADFGPSDLPL